MIAQFGLNAIPEILFGNGRLSEIGDRLTALAGPSTPVLLIADPALAKLDGHTQPDARARATLAGAVRGEICAFALSMPACWHTMVCVDTLEWLGGTDEVVVGPPVVRARTVGLTPSYMLRHRDVPPLALPR